MQRYDSHNGDRRSQDGFPACAGQTCDQERNAEAGQGGQVGFRLFAPVGEVVTQGHANADGDDYDLHDAPEHGYRAEGDTLADNQVGEERGHDRRQQSGNRGHGYGQG